MERICACLLLVLARETQAPPSPLTELVANNQPSEELPSWFPRTRCSAGVSHTTPAFSASSTPHPFEVVPAADGDGGNGAPDNPAEDGDSAEPEQPVDESGAESVGVGDQVDKTSGDGGGVESNDPVDQGSVIDKTPLKEITQSMRPYRAPSSPTPPALYHDDD